jgi:hypothetical protein
MYNPAFMIDVLKAVDPRLCKFSVHQLTKMLVAVVSHCDNAFVGSSMLACKPFIGALLEAATLQLSHFKVARLVDILEALAMAAPMDYFNPVFVHALLVEAYPKVAGFVAAHVSRFHTALLEITNVMKSEHVAFGDLSLSLPACVFALEARHTALAS